MVSRTSGAAADKRSSWCNQFLLHHEKPAWYHCRQSALLSLGPRCREVLPKPGIGWEAASRTCLRVQGSSSLPIKIDGPLFNLTTSIPLGRPLAPSVAIRDIVPSVVHGSMSPASKDLEELQQNADRLAIQLPRCSSRDEALDIAIQAAQTSFDALKLVTDPVDKAKYSTRAKQLLAQAEDIKKAADWKTAVQQYSAGTPAPPPDPPRLKVLPEPRNSRELSRREKIVVLRAGFLNGAKFPEWEKPPSPSEFELKDGEELFLYVLCTIMSIISY